MEAVVNQVNQMKQKNKQVVIKPKKKRKKKSKIYFGTPVQDAIVEYMDSVPKDKNGWPRDSEKDWMAMYPFNVGNLQEFITFCSESGGFTIG